MSGPLAAETVREGSSPRPRLASWVASCPGALRGWLRRAEVDQALVFASMTRLWLLAGAPVTLFLIARTFSPVMQGYYYTFASLIALQSFAELGFSLVIFNVASNEWSRLGLGPDGGIVGDPQALSRLVSLGRLVFRWYAVASALFVLVVAPAGYGFLAAPAGRGVAWHAPWLALVALSGVMLWALPFTSMLEGCNQVLVVSRFRMSQAVVGNLAMWATILLGGGLWAAPVWTGVGVAHTLFLLLRRYRAFFRPFFRGPTDGRINWRREVWPMQWRLALSGVVNYFAFSMFTPVMFRYHGAAVAGQMGMTQAAVNGVQSVAVAWVQTKAPRFGVFNARREYDQLDRSFRKTTLVSSLVLVAGALVLFGAVLGLNVLGHPLAGRLLPPLPTALLAIASLLAHVSYCESTYLRAHMQEPTVVLSVTTSLAIGLLVWLVGGRYGPAGASAGFLGAYALALVWQTFILRRCRAEWHRP